MNYRWYAVRCCCTPTKILGFLKLPLTTQEGNARVRTGDGNYADVKLKEISQIRCALPERYSRFQYHPPLSSYEKELAVYGEDRPIEFWRSFPDFMEVRGG